MIWKRMLAYITRPEEPPVTKTLPNGGVTERTTVGIGASEGIRIIAGIV